MDSFFFLKFWVMHIAKSAQPSSNLESPLPLDSSLRQSARQASLLDVPIVARS